MSQTYRVRSVVLAAAAALVVVPATAHGQATVAPTNNLPNPYHTVEGWAKMPQGRTWGATSAVEIDPDGTSVWVAERCGANSCLNADGTFSSSDVILKFDAAGKLVTSFAPGMIVFPHGIAVDPQGNVWVTDGQDNRPRTRPGEPARPAPAVVVGHQVRKFSPTGELLMTLGEPGGARTPGYFWQPNDVLIAPNGDVFVAEGHSSAEGSPARILKFDASGAFIKEWGTLGAADGQFNQPHALAMDSQGRLFVGDRGNNRVQIFDQEGNHIASWYQFSRPSGLFIDRNDILYVADSESGSVSRTRTDWKRGIRIGSARDGSVTAFIPDPTENPPSTSSAEVVAVDRNGVIYGAEVGQRALKRYERH